MKKTGYAYNDATGTEDIPTYQIDDNWYVTENREILYNDHGMMIDTPYSTLLSPDEIPSASPEEVKSSIFRVDRVVVSIPHAEKTFTVNMEERCIYGDQDNSQKYMSFESVGDDTVYIVFGGEMLIACPYDLPTILQDGDTEGRTFDMEESDNGHQLFAIMIAIYADIAPTEYDRSLIVTEPFDGLDPESDFAFDIDEPTDKNLSEYYGKGMRTIIRWRNGERDKREKRLYLAAREYYVAHCGS